VHLGIIFVNN